MTRPPASPRRWAYTLEVQATLRDTDGLGHVNHAVYLGWLEEARSRYVAARGAITRIEEFEFVLASCTLHFRSPVYFHESVTISLVPTRVGTKSWDLDYEGRVRSDRRLVVEGSTTQVQYDYRTKASKPIPDAWRRWLLADGEKA
ncbi:MAG TPA: thioesterase family protein [Candidatus Sulfotelmatobacter sp.]|nr:thioesterase family protein [Candidatus Sulfotelmatobacter sp.]